MSKLEFLTPVGRLVQGSVFEAQTKNKTGQPLLDKNGQPRVSYFIGVAFAKTDAAFGQVLQLAQQAARTGFPHLFNAQGQCTHPRFAWKIMDGDGVDDDGKPNANKPGFAGHWVLKCGSGFAPRAFYQGRYAPHEQIQDPRAIPRGYYVRVAGTIEGNGDAAKPGLYVNFSMVELVGGEPSMIINTGPDASAVFGGAAATLPAGVPPVAMGAQGNGFPGQQPMPMAAQAPTFAPASAGFGAPGAQPFAAAAPQQFAPPAAPSNPGMVVQPNPGFLNGPGSSPPPAMGAPGFPQQPGAFPGAAPNVGAQFPAAGFPAPSAGPATTSPSSPGAFPAMPGAGAPVAPQRIMTAAAQGYSYEQLIAQGFTDDTLRQRGLML